MSLCLAQPLLIAVGAPLHTRGGRCIRQEDGERYLHGLNKEAALHGSVHGITLEQFSSFCKIDYMPIFHLLHSH